MGEWYWLSDKGIRQALEQKLIQFDPPLEDRQIQPASIDTLFECGVQNFPISELHREEYARAGLGSHNPRCESGCMRAILPHCEAELRTTQSARWNRNFHVSTELRSSLRRLGCVIDTGITWRGEHMHLHPMLHNHGPITIELAPGDKIAQLIFKFEPPLMDLSFREHGMHYNEHAVGSYEQFRALDYGIEIRTTKEAEKLLKDGYFSITPQPEFERGLLVVRAADTARVLRAPLHVVLSQKKDISAAFEEVQLPYTLKPREHIDVDVQQHFALSEHIGIQFYDHLLFTSRSLFNVSREQGNSDFMLSDQADGWVDPGYQGGFSRQPKTFHKEGTVISPGDVLGHGVIVFYPNGVGRPYGSKDLGSHYQGDKKTKFTQGC